MRGAAWGWLVLLALTVCQALALAAGGCAQDDNGGCDEGDLACNDFCCPGAEFYACGPGPSAADSCLLVACEEGLYICPDGDTGRNGCIPISADCCGDGGFCTGEICCPVGDGTNTCIPVGTSCCGNGTFCPAGTVCCNNNTQCC